MKLAPGNRTFRKVEWAVAIAATAGSILLHLIFVTHAGGLWRDEAYTVDLAQMRTLKEVWANLHTDSFPLGWVMAVRLWTGIGLESDGGLRALGFIIGLLVLGALWFVARSFKMRFPIFTLTLIALNPVAIVYGDTMRAWGWGLFWIALAYGLVWRIVERPVRWNVVAAMVVGIAAVQSTYYNSVLLATFCCAGVIVAARRRRWSKGGLLIAIGIPAGISMLPYIEILGKGKAVPFGLVQRHYFIVSFLRKFPAALSGEEAFHRHVFNPQIWCWLLLLAILTGVAFQFLPIGREEGNSQKDLLLFGTATLLLVFPLYYYFLVKLSLETSSWYYLPLMLATALAFEAVFSVTENWMWGKICRLAVWLYLLCAIASPINGIVKLRMTNLDLIANELNHSVTKKDLIIVCPFYCATSFERYYCGAAPVVPLPEVGSKLHPFDLLVPLLMQDGRKEALQNLFESSSETLKADGTVWFVSIADITSEVQDHEPLPPPHFSNPHLVQTRMIMDYWMKETGYFFQEHSSHREPIPVNSNWPVNPYENGNLVKITGWRE